MKNQRDKLHQYQRKITVLTDKETEIAKQMLAKGDKQRALLALRRKKYQESLLAKTDAQLLELEKLTSNVEFALIQKDVVFGLQQGTKVLKEIHAEMGGIEHVEKLMGETADAIAYQRVRTAVSRLVSGCSYSDRKLAKCSEAGYRTTTRKRWKTSWRPWKPRWQAKAKNSRTSPTRNSPRHKNQPSPYGRRPTSVKPCWRHDDIACASLRFWILHFGEVGLGGIAYREDLHSEHDEALRHFEFTSRFLDTIGSFIRVIEFKHII